jgi:2-methylisocitrate lyase-like PEP mutase family enzyme
MPSSAADFLALHRSDPPLLLPNPWDIGSAKILAELGFDALATTSGGFAASLGHVDGDVTRDQAIAHAAEIGEATGLPVNADFEQCWPDDPGGVAETIRQAIEAGVVAGSIEDSKGDELFDIGLATERVAAAAEAAHSGPVKFALTARAQNLLAGDDDLDETIRRLQAYQEAGADVLFAPGVRTIEQIRATVSSVDLPMNVLVLPGVPPVAELADAGVARVSIGSAFALVAYKSLIDAATELRDDGTYGYGAGVREAYVTMREAFV